MKKLLTLLLALVLCFSATIATGCGGGGGIKIDETKTQLYVGSYDGGYGNVWLDKRIEAFEAKYAGTSFEDDKVGVQIIPEKNKTTMTGKSLVTNITKNEVIFTEAVYYYEFLKNDLLLDITDVLTGINDEGVEGDQAPIESKIFQVQKDYLLSNNKYYAVPHYSSFGGIMYDADLFAAKRFYFAQNGDFVKPNWTKEDLSNGPDGVHGSHDDGLPATYEEFFKLCKKMAQSEVTPLAWNQNVGYITWLLGALQADFEGLEQMRLLFDFEYKGTGETPLQAQNLIQVDDNGNITRLGPTTINNANGYLMYSQEGRYQALKFLEQIVADPTFYHSDSGSSTFSHTLAQQAFLLDSLDNTKYDLAMLVEGIWWEEEAKSAFEYAETQIDEQYSRQNRDIRYMTLPKANADKIGEKTTLLDIGKSFAFINKKVAEDPNPKKIELAKKFLKFCYTDEALQEFTTITNTPKSMNYELTDTQYNSLTNFGKSVWNVHSTADYVFPYSTNKLILDNQSTLDIYNSYQMQGYSAAAIALKGAKTAEQFFNGIINYAADKTRWESSYSNYFN